MSESKNGTAAKKYLKVIPPFDVIRRLDKPNSLV